MALTPLARWTHWETWAAKIRRPWQSYLQCQGKDEVAESTAEIFNENTWLAVNKSRFLALEVLEQRDQWNEAIQDLLKAISG